MLKEKIGMFIKNYEVLIEVSKQIYHGFLLGTIIWS